MQQYFQFLKNHIAFLYLTAGALVSCFLVTQIRWLISHNVYDDMLLRVFLAMIAGVFICLLYMKFVSDRLERRNIKDQKKVLLKVSGIHFPLYLSWIFLFLGDTQILTRLLIIIIVSGYLGIGIYFLKKQIFDKKHGQAIFFTAIFIILFISISWIVFGDDSRYMLLCITGMKILFYLSFLFLPGFYLLKIINGNFFNTNMAFLLGVPATITILSIPFIILQSCNAPPFLYPAVDFPLITMIIYFAHKKMLLKDILRVDSTLKYAVLLICIGALITASFVIAPPWDVKNMHWRLPAFRGFRDMPGDNGLQYYTAQVFIENKEPWRINSFQWTMGDRPPLMAAVNSMLFLAMGNKKIPPYWEYEIVGIILNMLYLLPLVLLVRSIFGNKGGAPYFLPVLIFIHPFLFFNVYYTWPKLFGIYFTLLSVVILWKKKLNPALAFICGSLWGLAGLCHSSALLSLPILFFLYSIFMVPRIKLKYLTHVVIFIITFMAFQSPWLVYKKFLHPSINTSHLMYHFMPEKYWKQDNYYTKNMMNAYFRFLKECPIEKQIDRRLKNLKFAIVHYQEFSQRIKNAMSGNFSSMEEGANRAFHFPITAIGEIPILISFLVIIMLICNYLFHVNPYFEPPFNSASLLFFFLFVILSYAFNITLRWYEPGNHQMPYLELVIAIVISTGIPFAFSMISRSIILLLYCSRFIGYVVGTAASRHYEFFTLENMFTLMGVGLLFYVAGLFRNRTRGEMPETHKEGFRW